jgi:hypothetical protein
MAGLTIEELEALGGIPADVIERGIEIGLYENGWLLEREPPRFHERTVAMVARTMPLLGEVRAGRISMGRFQEVLWTLAQAGPDRLVEYLSPPDNRTVERVLTGGDRSSGT